MTCFFLFCGSQHFFDEDAVAGGGIGDKDMGDRADDLAVLENGAAAHECVNVGPTKLKICIKDISTVNSVFHNNFSFVNIKIDYKEKLRFKYF